MSIPISSAPSILSGVFDPPSARKALGVGDVMVTDPAYGAIDDAFRAYFAVTWTLNGTSLGIQSYLGTVTVVNTGPDGVAVVTFPGSQSCLGNGYGPTPEWAGKPIAIDGAGASGAPLIARVARMFYDQANSGTPTL